MQKLGRWLKKPSKPWEGESIFRYKIRIVRDGTILLMNEGELENFPVFRIGQCTSLSSGVSNWAKTRKDVKLQSITWIEKGWTLEGETHVEEISSEGVQRFIRVAAQDMDVTFRKRLDEEGMNLYYYGPQDVAGSGEYEAVEFLDTTNSSIVVFFDLKTHLPSKWETHRTNQLGVRQKHEQELYKWHTIQGVHVPLRYDSFVDGKKTEQREIETINFNIDMPSEYFLQPSPQK